MIQTLHCMLVKGTAEPKKALFGMLLGTGANLFGNLFTQGKGASFGLSERYFVRLLLSFEIQKFQRFRDAKML